MNVVISSRVLLLMLLLASTSSCASVVIIQRSIPTLGEQLRPTTVSIPKDARSPITVRD